MLYPYRNIVVLTGAGISAESGIQTFRSEDGLWEEHRIEDVATPEGFYRDQIWFRIFITSVVSHCFPIQSSRMLHIFRLAGWNLSWMAASLSSPKILITCMKKAEVKILFTCMVSY